MSALPFLWTNDDISAGHADTLRRQLEMLDAFEIPGTFFVIPAGEHGAIDEDSALLRTIDGARQRGHEFHQHGCRHTPFECGVPESWMLDFAPEVRRQYDEQRLEIEAMHTREALTRMIEEGDRIWQRAFGVRSTGFRPGWGAFCGNLYRALDDLGFAWVSSRIPCPTSWLRNLGQWEAPIDFRPAVPAAPCPCPGIQLWELPISGGEYAFRVPHEPARIETMVNLAREEFGCCRQRDIPFCMVSHWHGLEYDRGSGYAVHYRFLAGIRESGQAEFMGADALYSRCAG